MFKLAPLIFRNLFRNRRRSLLTLASTAISLALLSLLIALFQGFFYADDTSPAEARRLVARHRVSLTQAVPASYQSKIAAVKGVEHVTAWSWFQGVFRDDPTTFFARFAVDADVIFDVHPEWIVPADQVTAFKRERTACAVGEAIATKYKLKLGDRVQIKGDIYPVQLDMTVAAIFGHPKNTEVLVFHREYLTELLPTSSSERDSVGTYEILATSAADVPRIGKAVDAMFENSPAPTRTESEKEFGRSFLAFLGNVQLFLVSICGAVTFTILLVSANTVAMSVRERTREMAILRTLGYTPGEILSLVLGESVVISVIGGVFGLGLGLLLGKGMEAASGMPFQGIKWPAVVIVLGVAAVVGLLAAVVPARIAAKSNVVESLRFTG